MVKEYKTITQIAGPLVFVEKTEPVGYKEIVTINLPDGTTRRGEVLDSSSDIVVIQIFEGTTGLDKECGVVFTGETLKLPASIDLLGRILSGSGEPLDGGPRIVPDQLLDINGAAMNICQAASKGFHPDRYLHNRRNKYPCPWTETAYFLSFRSSTQRNCSADRKAGCCARI